MFQVDYQAVEQHPCQYLPCYGQERDSSVVVTKLAISLFVEADDGRIFELLRYNFLIHIWQKRSVNFCSSVSPPCLYTSAGMASAPGAFPVESCLIAFLTSSTLGGLSRSVFVSTYGRRAIASALISADLLRTALKCSAHLFRMAGFVSDKCCPIHNEQWRRAR